MWRTRNPLWKAHDPEDIGEILLLQLGPRRHRPRDAGAFIDESSLARARRLGLDPAVFLSDNNSTGFFAELGDLLTPGPTFTNVNDFRAILVDRP